MVVTHNQIINAIALAEDVSLFIARARAATLGNGETPCKEQNEQSIEIEAWIDILLRAEVNQENGCIDDDDIWNIIQKVNEMYRETDCETNQSYSRNSSSGGGGNVPSGYVERVLGVNVDNTNPSRPVVTIYVDGITITGTGTQADPFVAVGGGGGAVWGTIVGVLSNQTDLIAALNAKITANASIVGATKTKITYDSKGLVTAGADATTTDIAEGTNLYYTNARGLTTVLTGLSITGGAILATDTVLQAFGKLQNQINAIVTGGNTNTTPITVSALNTLRLASTINTNTIYVVTDATPFVLSMQFEANNATTATAKILDNTYAGIVYYTVQTGAITGGRITDANNNIWNGSLPSGTTFGTSCVRNTIGQSANFTVGNGAIDNNFGSKISGFIFGNNLQYVTIEAGLSGADYTASPSYDFLYNNAYPSTIFRIASVNYHRYYDPANDRIVVTNLSTLAVSYIGGGSSLSLETNGTPNGDQTLLNLVEGANIDITDNGTGNVTITSLADRYKTTSVTSNTIGNGSKTFTVDANLSYVAMQEVIVVFDATNHMHGSVTSYSGTTLIVDIKNHTGSGTYTSWEINLDGTPVDAVTSPGGVANRLAYFTAAQVIDDAAAITASRALIADANGIPTHSATTSTELGYVSGVTSAIQTQINALPTASSTTTFTNKRITARTGTVASSATPTINTDNVDYYSITALAAAITSFTTNLSGTPTVAQTLWISITDDGTARAITWGASFEASTVALPTTTVISTRLDVAFIWNDVTSKWRCVGVA